MIPLRIHRALMVLFVVSAFFALLDDVFLKFGMPREAGTILSGILAGFLVFFMAYEGGRILVFCGKNLVDEPERRAKVRAALFDIGILEERRTRERRRQPRMDGTDSAGRRQDRAQGKQLMHVSIVDSDRFIAVTVNSGQTYRAFISTRMVDSLSHRALRSVLAHEYGHVDNHHPLKLAVMLGLVASVKLSIGVPIGAVIVVLLAYLFMLREWEYVADAAAVKRVSAEDVRLAFEEFQAIAGEKNMSLLSEFFSGHPSIHRRVAAIDCVAATT